MNNIDMQKINLRFDTRYGSLLRAGWKKHVISNNIGYVRDFEIHGLVGMRPCGVPLFISNSDLMWKPFEAFDSDIQTLLS